MYHAHPINVWVYSSCGQLVGRYQSPATGFVLNSSPRKRACYPTQPRCFCRASFWIKHKAGTVSKGGLSDTNKTTHKIGRRSSHISLRMSSQAIHRCIWRRKIKMIPVLAVFCNPSQNLLLAYSTHHTWYVSVRPQHNFHARTALPRNGTLSDKIFSLIVCVFPTDRKIVCWNKNWKVESTYVCFCVISKKKTTLGHPCAYWL